MDKDDIRLVALLQRVPRANRFVGLFVKSDDCDSHPLLFTSRATRGIHTLKRVNCTLALKNRAIRTKNQRANSPSCLQVLCICINFHFHLFQNTVITFQIVMNIWLFWGSLFLKEILFAVHRLLIILQDFFLLFQVIRG